MRITKFMAATAIANIAGLSFAETESRDESIANLRIAMHDYAKHRTSDGNGFDSAWLESFRTPWMTGRVAARLKAADLPNTVPVDDVAKRLAFAKELICAYASPVKPGSKPNKLRAGQIGRRTETQHKAVRAAQEAWSQVMAELGLGAAQTQKERNDNKKTRSTNATPVRGNDAKSKGKEATPAEAELPAAKDMTAAIAMQHITTQAMTLLAFANKHAKVLPASFGMAVREFNTAIGKASREHEKANA